MDSEEETPEGELREMMNAMQEAMLKAGVVEDKDVERLERQARISQENQRRDEGRERKDRWDKAYAALPAEVQQGVDTLNDEAPGTVNLKVLEGLVERVRREGQMFDQLVDQVMDRMMQDARQRTEVQACLEQTANTKHGLQ